MDSVSLHSMDPDDVLWSQQHEELLSRLAAGEALSSSEDEDGFYDEKHVGVDRKLSELRSHSYLRLSNNVSDANQTVAEDMYSSSFMEPMEYVEEEVENTSRPSDPYSEAAEEESDVGEILGTRSISHQEGGLESCTYDSAFGVIKTTVEDVESELERRYIREANRMLDNFVRELQASRFQEDSATQGNHRSRVKPSKLELFEVFLPPFLLEKLRSSINRVLSERRNGRESRKFSPVSIDELKGVIIQRVLAASYGESPSAMCSTHEQDAFLQMGIRADRYKEVWSALSRNNGKRSRATHIAGEEEEEDPTWTNKPERANALISELEQETSAINTTHLNIKGFTIYSLHDEHHQLSSSDVSQKKSCSK